MRLALLASTLMLTGCAGSGVYSHLGDTFTLPFGANPNAPAGAGENFARVRGHADRAEIPPMLFEPGDAWPEPPKPPPTLKELQAEQNLALEHGSSGFKPLQPLPQIEGFEVPEQQAQPFIPGAAFPQGRAQRRFGGSVTTSAGKPLEGGAGETGKEPIVVPNGNGTSTVISPNGSVSTIPTTAR